MIRRPTSRRRLLIAGGGLGAGKVMIFAVRLDTFPEEGETKVFSIGTNDPAELTKIRRLPRVRSSLNCRRDVAAP
jgi:hypothetical protein